jgi:PAS domain S-box-containing protein
MTDASEIEDAIARLADDPAFASFAQPTAALLVFDAEAERILWASPSAQPLRDALADAAPSPARDRLAALAGGLAPRHGMRLERLRLFPGQLSPPTVLACRLVTLRSGASVLVTAVVGAPPKLAPLRHALSAEPAAPPAAAAGGTLRVVWQTDAETRFVHVSPGLSEIVGPMAADILGRTWQDVTKTVVEDPEGTIAALLAQRQTFSGRAIRWRVDNTSRLVLFDWAGMPIFGPDRQLTGYRGFGLLRTGADDDALATVVADQNLVPEGGAPVEHGQGATEEAPAASPPAELSQPAAGEDIAEAGPKEADAQVATPAAVDSGPQSAEHVPVPPVDALGELPPSDPVPSGEGGLPRPVRDAPERTAPPRASRSEEAPSRLSTTERSALREIARALGARFEDEPLPADPGARPPAPPVLLRQPPTTAFAGPPSTGPAAPARPSSFANNGDRILDRLPIGVLVHRGERLLFANRLLLDLVDYDNVGQIAAEGGIVRLFRGSPTLLRSEEGGAPLALSTRHSESIAVDVRLTTVEWDGLPASLMLIRKIPEADAAQRLRSLEADLRLREARMRELDSILDTATDGVIVVDETGRILSLNRSAEALFGYDDREVVGDAITVLLAPESHIIALDYLDGLRSSGVASLLNDGREVMGRVRQGGTIPLFMTMGRVNDSPDRKFCAVLRDITAFKKAEGELLAAKRAAEEASSQKSDLLAKISHEIRTPLNAIIGFAEVMLEERFGPVGNDRYKDYLKDVHASGAHVISLVNDLLDLAKIEAGRMELTFTSVSLNDLVATTVTLLQPQAARERIVMRTSFAPKLPPVVADERSVRQIVLNLVSNAIKFTDAGGQVIVSTALTDRGEVAFRVRDTGIGMTEEEIQAALEPFRQLATARKRGGTGLGLPLTKALVEANRGALQISSSPNEGTLVEVLFPPMRVLAA